MGLTDHERNWLKILAAMVAAPYGYYVETSDENLVLLESALARLTPREEFILRHRCGDRCGHVHTYAEVAACEALWSNHEAKTPERMRQIASKALRKLRRPSSGLNWNSWTTFPTPK